MCAYFSKVEDQASEAMKQVAKEALHGKKSDFKKNENNCKKLKIRSCLLDCHVRSAVA